MNFRLELICVKGDGTVERREVLTIAKEQLATGIGNWSDQADEWK